MISTSAWGIEATVGSLVTMSRRTGDPHGTAASAHQLRGYEATVQRSALRLDMPAEVVEAIDELSCGRGTKWHLPEPFLATAAPQEPQEPPGARAVRF